MEPPVYRPFALVALAATLLAATPLGTWMLARLHWGGGPVPAEHVWLHAHLQVFGFFATLIVGVAHHLVPRFSGRPVARTRLTPWLAGAIGTSLALRIGGTASEVAVPTLVAALLQTCAFAFFGAWVWRALEGPHLAATRVHLGAASAWLVAALGLEAGLRAWAALGPDPTTGPDPDGMRAAHAMAIFGGIVGWIAGVVLRAGPMLVPRWSVPDPVARAVPWSLGLGVLIAVFGVAGPWPGARRAALEHTGQGVALAAVAAVALTGGALRRARGALPILARGRPETGLFRMAMLAAALAAAGSAGAAAMVSAGAPLSLLADALRHLVMVGVLTSMVVGMGFRLIPIMEGTPLSWPGLREVAFWALLAGVVLRTAGALADYGLESALLLLPLSGVLVWIALACLAASLLGAIRRRDRPMTRIIGGEPGRRSLEIEEEGSMSHTCGCHHDTSAGPGHAALATSASAIAPEETVETAARRSPRALEILRDLGIDTCCGGRLTLAQAAASAGVRVETVLRALSEPGGSA